MARCVIQQEEEERQRKTLHRSSCSCHLWQPSLSLFFTSLLSFHLGCSFYFTSSHRTFISHHARALLLLLFYNFNSLCSPCFWLYHVASIMVHLIIWMYNFRYNRRHNVGRLDTESMDQEEKTPEAFQLAMLGFWSQGKRLFKEEENSQLWGCGWVVSPHKNWKMSFTLGNKSHGPHENNSDEVIRRKLLEN